MKEIIDDLKDLSGVIGACLYHGQQGVMVANLPAIFTTEKLTELGKLLMKIYSAGQMNFHDLTDLSLQYEESAIFVRDLEDNQILFLLCDPGFNQNLLTMSLNLAQQELKNRQPPLAASTLQETLTAPAADIAPILAAMKAHLPKIMGPMADIVFDETVEIWEKQGDCTASGLKSLVHLLSEEIGSTEKITRFKELIAPEMTQAVKEQ